MLDKRIGTWISDDQPKRDVHKLRVKEATHECYNKNWELWNRPRSLLKRTQRRVSWSHGLSKFDFFSLHAWRGARYQFCVRIDKLDRLWMSSHSLVGTLPIDYGRFNQCVVDLRIFWEYWLENVHEFTNTESLLVEENHSFCSNVDLHICVSRRMKMV
jgi:hypothetical protein